MRAIFNLSYHTIFIMREINCIGIIMLYNGTTAPEGWLPCDGRALKIDQNPALYAVIGNQFGANLQYEIREFNLPVFPKVGSCMHIICVNGEFPTHD